MNSIVQNKDDLLARLLEKRAEIEKHGIRRLGLFGSFMKNQVTQASDVDFLVEFHTGKKNYQNFIELAEFLESLCQRRVELVTPESLSPYLADSINSEVEYILGSD